MAKMRVHELAKELNIKSQEIIAILSTTEYAVKSAQSGLEIDAQNFVRSKFVKDVAEKPQMILEETDKEEKEKAENHKEKIEKEKIEKEKIEKEKIEKEKEKEKSKEKIERDKEKNKEKADKEKVEKEKEKGKERDKEKTEKDKEERERDKEEKDKEKSREKSKEKDKEKDKDTKIIKSTQETSADVIKERPKKKASISAVYNAQYSKQSRRPANGNANGNNNGSNNGQQRKSKNASERGQKRENGNNAHASKQEAHSIIRPRPVGERAMRPISERTANNNDDFAESRLTGNNQPNGNRPPRSSQSNAERPSRGNQQSAERPVRNNNDRNGNNNNGNRSGNRNGTERGSDKGNDRGSRNNERGNVKGRFDREIDRFNKDNVSAQEEVRGKESRERNNNDRRNNNNKKNQDRDKLGKRQENYINLEKHGGKKKLQQPVQQPKEEANIIKTLTLPEKITLRDFAERMKVQPSVIVKKLFMKGQMVTVNSEITFDEAEEIALEFNYICEAEEKVDVIAELLKEEEEDTAAMIARPPVVCVMGHVDHGKTSLLDAIRETRVTDREAGGITQHIGASVVSINDQNITFLDTPGHEAFTAMRMRGANSTDIAILVVAADDGVMPQTIEAINHAKAAGVEIIVAVNKIDKPSANIDKVKQELSEYELIPEDWGGSTVFCPVSAHTKEGIDNLLEMILLTAEVLELRANPKRNARGLVIEAQLDKGRGAVATVLVQKGTLHVGDSIACGSSYGKVRAMIDDKGRRVKEAIPSTPVEILGLNSVPAAGETFVVCDSDKEAKSFADTYISEEKNKLIEETKAKMSLDDLFSQIQSGNMKELDIIVKADVQGSVEAVKQSLVKLSNEEVLVKVIHGGVGAINESDVILASASNAIIIGFNVRPDPIAKVTAEREGVDVRLYKVIYNAIEDVEAAMKGMLDPVFEEKIIGHAEIRQIFKASGVGNIAGSYILDGVFERGCRVRISREGNQIFEGDLGSLKRFKDDVKEVRAGYECGLVFEGFNDIQELDIVEAYKMVEVPR